jgi:hypothetical protein
MLKAEHLHERMFTVKPLRHCFLKKMSAFVTKVFDVPNHDRPKGGLDKQQNKVRGL